MKVVKLKDCVLKILDCRGKTPKKLGSDWVNKGIKVISANNVHDGILTNKNEIRYVTEDIYRKWMKEPVLKGDCFLSSEGATLGESMYWDSDEKIVLGQRLYSIRTNPQILDSKYFSMYLRSDICQKLIKNISTGSTVFGISQKDLLNLNIIVPDIKNQQKIGILYYNINKKIELNNKINVELEDMAKTIYNYWFLQFEFPNEEGKPYKSSGGKMVWNEEMKREIPEDWEINKLGNIFSFIKGKNPDSLSNEKNSYNSYPYINIEVATGGKIQFCNGKSMILSDGETIMVMDGAASGDIYIGNSGVLGSTFSKLMPKDENISNSLIYQILEKIKPIYKKANIGSTVPHANKSFIENIQIALPKNVSYFSNFFDEIYSKININKKENLELASLRDFLLPLLMNGQVGFKD